GGVPVGDGGGAHRGPVGREDGPQARRARDRGGRAEGAPGNAGEARHEVGREGRRVTVAEFFIRRPIVAIVIAILIVLLGAFVLPALSIEHSPFVAPPTIRITATYPGSSAVAVEQSVATPIEQEVNGVESM